MLRRNPTRIVCNVALAVALAAASLVAFTLEAHAETRDWDKHPVPVRLESGSKWELDATLSDEFNYDTTTPDGRGAFANIWSDHKPDNWFGPGATHFSKDNYVVNGGVLTIFASRIPTAKQTPSDDEGFTRNTYTSYITSKATLRPGCYTEVMMKGTATTLSSNFWMIDDKNETEIDVVEIYGDGDWFPRHPATDVHFQRRGGNGDVHKQAHHPKDGTKYAFDFHRYGVYWISDTQLQFFYDGQRVRTLSLPKEIVDPSGKYLDQPVRLILDLEAHAWRGTDKVPTDADLSDAKKNNMQVDWVRTYRAAAAP